MFSFVRGVGIRKVHRRLAPYPAYTVDENLPARFGIVYGLWLTQTGYGRYTHLALGRRQVEGRMAERSDLQSHSRGWTLTNKSWTLDTVHLDTTARAKRGCERLRVQRIYMTVQY